MKRILFAAMSAMLLFSAVAFAGDKTTHKAKAACSCDCCACEKCTCTDCGKGHCTCTKCNNDKQCNKGDGQGCCKKK